MLAAQLSGAFDPWLAPRVLLEQFTCNKTFMANPKPRSVQNSSCKFDRLLLVWPVGISYNALVHNARTVRVKRYGFDASSTVHYCGEYCRRLVFNGFRAKSIYPDGRNWPRHDRLNLLAYFLLPLKP